MASLVDEEIHQWRGKEMDVGASSSMLEITTEVEIANISEGRKRWLLGHPGLCLRALLRWK